MPFDLGTINKDEAKERRKQKKKTSYVAPLVSAVIMLWIEAAVWCRQDCTGTLQGSHYSYVVTSKGDLSDQLMIFFRDALDPVHTYI